VADGPPQQQGRLGGYPPAVSSPARPGRRAGPPPSRKKLLLASVVIGLLLLEGGLRLTMGNFAQSRILQRSDDPDVCLEVRPDTTLRYTGWRTRIAPTTFRTNRFGARGPDFAVPAEPGVLRIAAVGDSFTFGQGVEEDEAFGQVMARALQARGIPAEVLNFGVPGHSTPQEVALVRHKVLATQPDVVLLHVFVNDLTVEESYCDYGSGGIALGKWLLHNVYVARQIMMLTHAGGHGAGAATGVDGSPGERFVASLKELEALGREHDFLTAAVLLTDRQMYRQRCPGCDIAHDLVTQAPIHQVDLSPVWAHLQRDIDANFIRGDDHFTVVGNEIVGEALAGAVSQWPELKARVVRVRQESLDP